MAFDKEKAIVTAQKYADKDQHDKAIREYLKILETDPKDPRVLLLIATSYERCNKPEDAGSSYVKVYEIYRDQGAYQKALAILKQAQRCLPQSDDIAMNMAEIYGALGLPHEAVNQLEKCLERAESSGNHRTYAKILQTMVRVDSENVQTRTRYAAMLKNDGDVEGACRQYSLALAQLLSKERYVDYIQTSREYLKIAPYDTDVLHSLANIYIRMNRFNDALIMLSEVPADERTPDIHEQIVTCYNKLGRKQDAANELKLLARQYEARQSPEDLVESVWLRAQKLAPNDSEILVALGDDVPMLSDSALNIVLSPAMERERAEAHMHSPSADNSALGQMHTVKYNDALRMYQSGDLERAKDFCMQIISGNEQHLPALNLLAQIFEQVGDMFSLAQIERKIARAVYETDVDEAVRHVLIAEKCTPRAWENFNLMLVFGLEPSKYGMLAPESSALSHPRINAAQMSAAPSIPSKPKPVPPPIPKAAQNKAIPSIPPVPSKAIVPRASRSTLDIPSPIREISGDVMRDLQNLESRSATDSPQKFVSPYQKRSNQGKPSNDFSISQIGRNLSNDIDDVFDGMLFNDSNSSARPAAASMNILKEDQTSSYATPVASPAVPASLPPHAAPSAPTAGTPGHAMGAAASIPIQPHHTSGLHSAMPVQPPTSAPIPVLNNAPASVAGTSGHAVSESRDSLLASPAQIGIPDDKRQAVEEAIQEIDFYASLSLQDDAKRLLQALVDEFGDVDIIHDVKIRLGAQ